MTINELDSVISNTYNAVQKINVGDVDMLPIYDCTLNESELVIESFKTSNVSENINTSDDRMVEIYRKYNDLLASIPKLRVIINQYLAFHDFWYYKKGLDMISRGDTLVADYYFDKSIRFNPFYIPSIYQKAIINLSRNNIAQAAYLLEDVETNLYPTGVNLNLINGLIELIRKRFSEYGNKLLAQEDYNGSLELFLEADTFCNHYHKFDCNVFQKGISASKYGLYHSYLRVANQALEANKISIAETFILKAKDYATLNRTYIVDDNEVDKNIKKLSKIYMELAFSYKNNTQNMQADYYFQKADGLCKLIKDDECSKLVLSSEKASSSNTSIVIADNTSKKHKHSYKKHKKRNTSTAIIASASKPKKNKNKTKKKHTETIEIKESETNSTVRNSYWKYIDEGNKYATENKFQLAIDNYTMAKGLETTASFATLKELDSLVKQNVKNIINNDLQTAGFMVWANELTNADSIYTKSIRTQKQYGMEKDEETNASIALLKQKMLLKDCQNLQDRVDMNTAMAKSNVAMRDYVRAGTLLEDVQNLVIQHRNCVLLTTNADEILDKIKPIITYYKYKEQAKAAYAVNDLKTFAQNYHAADVLFKNAKLDTAKIQNTDIVGYLSFQNNADATYFTAKYYNDINDWDGCLELLKLLRDQHYASNITEEIQVNLAKAKALTDGKKTFKLSVETMIINYTGGDKWFKYFNKAYKAAY